MMARGVRAHWLALSGVRDYVRTYRAQRRRLAALRYRLHGAVELLPVPYPRSEMGVPLLARLVRRHVSPDRPFILHARGHDGCRLALAVRRRLPAARVIFDVRGESEAELRYEANGDDEKRVRARVERFRGLERRAVEEADLWLCVSHAMAEHLGRLYPGLARRAPLVVPCAASGAKFHFDEALRAETRQRLGLPADAPVLAFVGQLIRYEMPEATVALASAARRVWPNLHLLVLTPHTEAAQRLLAAALPARDYTVRSAAHHEINAYLNAADVGLLLREAHLLNRVACPTKFAEYALTGLPVILTRDIGDCSAWVREHQDGIVLDQPHDLATVTAALPGLAVHDLEARRQRSARARRCFAREAYEETYLAAYRRLLGADRL